MADNLESYFKKYLTDDKPGEDNWNVPSDEVWENVLPLLRKKPGLFIPRKVLFILGGIILSLILMIFLWPYSTVKNRKAERIVSSEKIKKPIEESPSISKPVFESATSGTRQVNKIRKGYTLSSEKEASVSKNRKIKDEIYPKKNKKPLSHPHKKNGFNSFKKNTTISFSLSKDIKVNINEISPRCSDIPLNLNRGPFSLKKPPDSKQTKESPTKKKEIKPFNNNGKTGLGAFFAPAFTSTYINDKLGNSTMIAGNMFLYSNDWGFNFRYFISNRVTFVMGIEKTEIKSWSKSLVNFNYDPTNEHFMPDGEKENTSVVPMPTPFGEMTTEITYRFPGEQQFPDGEIMLSVLETHQEVKYLSIPAGLEFNIIRFSRFGWFTEAGVQFNRALRDATNFTSQVLHQEDEMKVVNERMANHLNYIRNYLGFYAGTGLNFRLSKFVSATSSFRYSGNITYVNLQDNLSTYVHGFNFRLGFVYFF